MDKKLKEVSLKEYLMWYEKLVKHEPNETTIEEFESEIQNWNLYDVTYHHIDEKNQYRFIKLYGIPTPYLQSYLFKNFKPMYDFTLNGISNLKVTPHDSDFRKVILNDGSNQGDIDRSSQIQIFNLSEWGEEMFNKNRKN